MTDSIEFKRYEAHVDLYKFYLDLAIKIDAFYLTAAGVFLSIFFNKPDSNPMFMSFAATLCAVASVCFYYWMMLIVEYHDVDEAIKEQAMMRIGAEFNFLRKILMVSAGFAATISIMLFLVMFLGLTKYYAPN